MARFITPLLTAALLVAHCAASDAQAPVRPPAEAGAPGEQLAPETNPAVRAALELPRTEPRHHLNAILALIDLGRPELAAPILQELHGLNLSDAQRAALVREFGSHRMLQLARATALGPAGAEFAEACMAAAAGQARDRQNVERLIEQLTDASVRQAARADLASVGQPGVVAVLEAFAGEGVPQRRERLMAAAVRLHPLSVGPLLGMLSTSDPTLKADVIRMLQSLDVSQAQPLVAAEQATDSASAERAERRLVDAIGRYQLGTPPFPPDERNQIELWQWDDATERLRSARYPADEARTIWAARLALELARLRPENSAYQRQAFLLGLEAAGLMRGNSQSGEQPSPTIESLLAAADGATLSTVLSDAMKYNYTRASVAAAERLGRSEDVSVLYSTTPQPAPLAEALVYPNRRVRYAALRAIMSLDPPTPFPGSSRVPEALRYFATSTGERRAVVAMGVSDHATTVAGRLMGMGFEADAATRGGTAFQLAQQSADLEFILVDMNIDGPGIRDVLYALRTNAATGHMPIGLLATSDRLDAANRLAAEHKRVVAYPRPQNDETLARIVERLSELSPRDDVPPQERSAMAGQALEWLGTLLERNITFYDLTGAAALVDSNRAAADAAGN